MAIKSIELKNFTVFENMECEFSSGVNIFIGENGTGKTHLLKVLYSFCCCDGYPDVSGLRVDSCFVSSLAACFNGASRDELVRKIPANDTNSDIAKFRFTINGDLFSYDITKCNEYVSAALRSTNKQQIQAVFIPAKDMLTHSRGLLTMAKKHSNDMPFDKTLLNVIRDADNWKVDEIPKLAKKIIPALEEIIGGQMVQQDGDFFIIKSNGNKVRFSLEAEGIKKFGLLWQLLMTEVVEENSILIWDEPEANLNPKLIPKIVDILLELSRNSVQIFLATHDYNLIKSFNQRKKASDNVAFTSLYKTENGVASETEDDYSLLKNNAIVDANIKLLEEDIEGIL